MTPPSSPRELTGPLLALAVVRFVAELGMVAALAYVGWAARGSSTLLGAILAALLPVAAAVTWGRWVAPKSPRRLADPARLAVEVVLFAAAVIGLVTVGGGLAVGAAVVLAAAYAVSAPVGRAGH